MNNNLIDCLKEYKRNLNFVLFFFAIDHILHFVISKHTHTINWINKMSNIQSYIVLSESKKNG